MNVEQPGASAFTQLSDVPHSYVSFGSQVLTVKVTENGLQFSPAGGGAAAWGTITGTLSSQTDLQNALNLKANLASPTFTGTVAGITATMVGLGNVDNVSDVNKPVSTAQAAAIALKVASVTAGTNVTVTGTATAPIVNVPTMTSTVGGATPTPPNSALQFLNGIGGYSTPAGGTSTTVNMGALVYADGSVPGGNTVANTITETALTSSYTIPANSLVAGNVIQLQIAGVYGTDIVAPMITAKIKIGSVVVASTGAITAVAAVTNGGYTGFLDLIVTTTGAAGVVESQGFVEFATAATTALTVNLKNTAAVTGIDFTAAQTVTVTIQWGTAAAANTITMRQMELYINKINAIAPALNQDNRTVSTNQIVLAGYCAIIARKYLVNLGIKLSVGSGGALRIL